jgi:hypothetical protein
MPYRQSGATCFNSGGILSVVGRLRFAGRERVVDDRVEVLHRLRGKGNEVFRLPAKLTVG